MPHKFTAFEFCATTTTRTKLLGAVSVTRRNSDGSWHGDTMDGAAFVKGSKTPALTLRERECRAARFETPGCACSGGQG